MGSGSSTPTACNGTLPATFYLQDANNVSAYYYVAPSGGDTAPVSSGTTGTTFYVSSQCLGGESNTSCIPTLAFNSSTQGVMGAYVPQAGGHLYFQQIVPGNTVLVNGATLVTPSLDTCKNQIILTPYSNTDIQPVADANNTYSCTSRKIFLGTGGATGCKRANLTETKIS